MKISIPSLGDAIKPGKLICIGRNYLEHVKELNSPIPSEPVVFLKPSSALVGNGGTLVLPKASQDVHHEVELVMAIGKGGKNIPRATAMAHVAAYAVGLDMTARDIQSRAKKVGNPWSVAKGFDTFAPIGDFVEAAALANPQAVSITLKINGEVRQQGNTQLMMFPLDFIIAYVSSIFTLEEGDLIYTGTPEGVGPVFAGDVLEATVEGLPSLCLTVAAEV